MIILPGFLQVKPSGGQNNKDVWGGPGPPQNNYKFTFKYWFTFLFECLWTHKHSNIKKNRNCHFLMSSLSTLFVMPPSPLYFFASITPFIVTTLYPIKSQSNIIAQPLPP